MSEGWHAWRERGYGAQASLGLLSSVYAAEHSGPRPGAWEPSTVIDPINWIMARSPLHSSLLYPFVAGNHTRELLKASQIWQCGYKLREHEEGAGILLTISYRCWGSLRKRVQKSDSRKPIPLIASSDLLNERSP